MKVYLKVYNLNEITDSKIMYNKKPPKFMKYILLIVSLLIILSVVWAAKSIKTYIIKSKGIVVSENKSHIMTKGFGEIKKVCIKEGSVVKKGDLLFSINGVETDIQIEQISSQIKELNKRIDVLSRAERNAIDETNDFNINNENEREFYNKLKEAYLARKEFILDKEELKNQGYDDEQIKKYDESQKNKYREHYYKTISQFTNEKKQYESELFKLVSQKKALSKGKEEYKIIAKKDGIVHINTSITPGMVVQGGTLIGTITNKKDELIIENMVTANNRPRIQLGDEVDIVVEGLLQSEYGTLQGKVIEIDEDATIDDRNGSIYFKIKVKPNKTYLNDSKGKKINITKGMVTETRIKYEKITYMKYILDLIGFKVK